MFAKEETLLSTKYEILKENHETLQKDYASLQLSSNLVKDMKDLMKSDFQNQIKELESRNLRLRESFEKERTEKELKIEELKNEVRIVKEKKEEELKKLENEIKIVKENKDEEMVKWQNKYNELAEIFDEVQKECSELRSVFEEAKNQLFGQEENNVKETVTEGFGVADMEFSDDDAVNLIDEGKNNTVITERIDNVETNCSDSKPNYGNNENDEVIVVGEKKTEKDAIMISDDDSDVEYHNPPRESTSNITIPQTSVVGVKQEPQSDGEPNSSKVNLVSLSPSSSSSSSSDEFLYVQFPVKKASL